ncbi:hypothetical protein BDZ89DRAFT_1059043 [Hymenopellis radicata]|nr:hypothetical protein BDZ89DRAFT_1059043 [Hymenopellis radicata]
MDVIQPFPDMPLDLLREIFEFALTLVSSFARHWTLPIIYRNVVLSSSRAVTSFLDAISDCTRSSLTPFVPLCRRVKNLGIFALGPMPSIQRIISCCTDMQSLACGFSLHSYSHHIALQHSPIHPSHTSGPLEKHLLSSACRDGIPFSLISSNTTHLHLQISIDVLPSVTAVLDHLPQLTHLALSVPTNSSASLEIIQMALAGLLDTSSELQVLYMQVMGSRNVEVVESLEAWNTSRMEGEKGQTSDRLVISKAPISVVKQWGETAGGGLWEEAEREIQSRCCGDI